MKTYHLCDACGAQAVKAGSARPLREQHATALHIHYIRGHCARCKTLTDLANYPDLTASQPNPQPTTPNPQQDSDPADLTAAIFSLLTAAEADAKEYGYDLSHAYRAGDGFLREVHRVANLFCLWADEHVDWNANEEVWCYKLRESFGTEVIKTFNSTELEQFEELHCPCVAVNLGAKLLVIQPKVGRVTPCAPSGLPSAPPDPDRLAEDALNEAVKLIQLRAGQTDVGIASVTFSDGVVKRLLVDYARQEIAAAKSQDRFILCSGANNPPNIDDSFCGVYDQQAGRPVFEISRHYRQLLALEIVGDSHFTALTEWLNSLSNSDLESEGLPITTAPFRQS